MMPTPATSHLDPPKSWEEFEEICADLFSREWKDPNTTKHGRQGQRQNGVDIYGRPSGTRYAGVQCKGGSKWPPDTLTIREIDEEVNKAKSFTPKLSEYIIATIGQNDVALQNHARRITEEHEQVGLFSVHIAPWSELMRRISQHPELIRKHYSYTDNALILQEVRDLRQELRDQGATTPSASEEEIATSRPITEDPSIAHSLEDDLRRRYDTAMQRSLFPEGATIDEFQPLADAASGQQYASASPSLRRRILLRASRSASVRSVLDRAKGLLALAQPLAGEDDDGPARALIAAAEGNADRAITLLRDRTDADSRSVLLGILFRARGPACALEWFAGEHLNVGELTSGGATTLCLCHLRRMDFESVRVTLSRLTPHQLDEGAYLLFLRAAAELASVLSPTEQHLVLDGPPLELMRARTVVTSDLAVTRLDAALSDLGTFMPIARTLACREALSRAAGHFTWCELLHPYRQQQGLARLRQELQNPKTALSRLPLAFAYDASFEPTEITSYLKRREQLGGLDETEVRAMLILRLHSDSPRSVADLITQYRSKLEASISPLAIASFEIQALAKAGDAISARQILTNHQEAFSTEARAALESEVSKAEGADPVEQDLRHYEATGTVEALRSLIQSLKRKGDHRAIARYCEELHARTGDPLDMLAAAHALCNLGDGSEVLRVMDNQQWLCERDARLARCYAWHLFWSGRLKEARRTADTLKLQTPSMRDLQLELAIAIESGEWESLAGPLAAFLDEPSRNSGVDLVRAAHLAQASGQGPMLDLLKAAIAKDDQDPNLWLGAYALVMEEGLEDQFPESHQWLERALALSGPDGPIRRFELRELLPQQQEWREREKLISDSVKRGETPLIVAAEGLRTTVIDILLRNLVRNSENADSRRKIPVPLFSGSRLPERCGEIPCLVLDVSALLVLGWLRLLPIVFRAFPNIVLPATILSELFEGRKRVQRIQKSRINQALEIEKLIAKGHLKVTRTDNVLPDSLHEEVGSALADFIRTAESVDGVILRPAPIQKPNLEPGSAEASTYTQSLCDMHTMLSVLIERGAIDSAKEDTARKYFKLQDEGWPGSARPDPRRPLFIDGLALVYLQYTGLLHTVLRVFDDVRIPAAEHDDSLGIIDHNQHVTAVLTEIDAIRGAIREANSQGKITFGSRRKTERVDQEDRPLSTLHLLSDLSHADAVVCDDRALNKEPFAQDPTGRRIPCITTLDLIEELKHRTLIRAEERRSLRHRLRAAGVVLMPIDADEIASAAARSGDQMSAELRAIRDSTDIACLAEVPVLPRELPWLARFNLAAKNAIFETWKTLSDVQRATAASDMIAGLAVNPEDWIGRWGGHLPPEWVNAIRSISVASLAIPVQLRSDQVIDSYNDWLEQSILGPMRTAEPEQYRSVVAQIKRLIFGGSDGDED
jgi:hypothetical protein